MQIKLEVAYNWLYRSIPHVFPGLANKCLSHLYCRAGTYRSFYSRSFD